MQQSAQSGSSPTSANFARMLASLTIPPPEDPASQQPSDQTSIESELGDDVVSLSYERALRTHARYKPPEANWRPTQTGQSGAVLSQNTRDFSAVKTDASLIAHTSRAAQLPADWDLRSVSVTVRLSRIECAQLHKLAAEAGVTVSAYLRSCTFEAESLRAQVKQALADLRSTPRQLDTEQRSDGAGLLRPPAHEEVRLRRVLGRIGRLCVGISAPRQH